MQLRAVVAAAAAAATLAAVASSEAAVRIYFYDVPPCAREGARRFAFEEDAGSRADDTSPALTPAERFHLRGMLRQILAVEAHLEKAHRVKTPEEASLFFIPAHFPLLFWLDQRVQVPGAAQHLACVNETFRQVERLPYWSRNGGYDHVILYGYEYPHWKRLSHLVLDAYSPFAANVVLLAVSLWNQGRRTALLESGLYTQARVIAIPYFATWDCAREVQLLAGPRDAAVAFVGSAKRRPPYFVFRERLLVAAAAGRPALRNDSRLRLEVFPADEEHRFSFAKDYEAERGALYARSVFCLVMPGDGNTAGRLFDVLMAGCVPVFLFHPDSYPVLPFAGRLPWRDFAMAMPIATEEDAVDALTALLEMPAADQSRYRLQVLKHAPLVALALKGCPPETPSALSMISAELRDRLELLHTYLLPGFSTFASPVSSEAWLCWGPSCQLNAGG